jgi:HD superfamily phosphodiesterase
VDTLSASGARAGILYLAEETQLKPAAALDETGSAWAGELPALEISNSGPLLGAALSDGSARAERLRPDDIRCLGLATADLSGATHAIALPLLNRQTELVGAMVLLCDSATDSSRLSFVKALSGSAAVSLESKALIKAQKDLFEAFIKLIAAAIDAKSPYTGGHCKRVPELTEMLADAACEASSGPFQDFQLSEDEREALHVAAWLHDCGKVTTPEYVVDKATKLETIHDRLHEVRMRFEVLKREEEIRCLQAIADGGDEPSLRAGLAAELLRIDDDFAFIANCNEGGEFMAPQKIERLQVIARRTWWRTLDDRIGISEEEKLRKARTPPALAAGRRTAAGRQARAPLPETPTGSNAGRQPLGGSHGRSDAALQPRRTLQSRGRARHIVGRRALQNQRAHRADAGHALAIAFPQTPSKSP